MNKDVIYIDVEDDITAIIGKVKSSKERIIALVPPKHIGVLQSAVNLRLLARAASQSDKHLVVVTNNHSLATLAGAASLPVAKNLQSKPNLVINNNTIKDETEDIIDGSQLPVGDLANAVDEESNKRTSIPVSDANEDKVASQVIASENAKEKTKPNELKNNKKSKVPNFKRFRKKLIFAVGGGVLLVLFLVWAFFIAPRATIIISAKTTDLPVNTKVTLSSTSSTDLQASTIKATTQQLKKDESIEFEASGKKEAGEQASGTISIRNCDSNSSFSIASGTIFTASSGQRFLNSGSVTVPGFTGSASLCRSNGTGAGVASVPVRAEAIGEQFNISSTSYSIAGVSGDVYATGTAMTGGSKRQVSFVTAEDIQRANDSLIQKNSETAKTQLSSQFGSDVVAIDTSFSTDVNSISSNPAVGQETTAGVKPKLNSSVTYTMLGIENSETKIYLDAFLAKQLEDKAEQQVYSNGSENAKYSNIVRLANGQFSAQLVATAKIGPKIDESAIKSAAKGKRYGEIQSSIESIEGVNEVDIKFSPFWVRSTPNDISKIDIEFKLDES